MSICALQISKSEMYVAPFLRLVCFMFTLTIVFIGREIPLLMKASLPAPGKTLKASIYICSFIQSIFTGVSTGWPGIVLIDAWRC